MPPLRGLKPASPRLFHNKCQRIFFSFFFSFSSSLHTYSPLSSLPYTFRTYVTVTMQINRSIPVSPPPSPSCSIDAPQCPLPTFPPSHLPLPSTHTKSHPRPPRVRELARSENLIYGRGTIHLLRTFLANNSEIYSLDMVAKSPTPGSA